MLQFAKNKTDRRDFLVFNVVFRCSVFPRNLRVFTLAITFFILPKIISHGAYLLNRFTDLEHCSRSNSSWHHTLVRVCARESIVIIIYGIHKRALILSSFRIVDFNLFKDSCFSCHRKLFFFVVSWYKNEGFGILICVRLQSVNI